MTHSCAHALSMVTNMHHGLANAVMIDHALVHNLPSSQERFQRLVVAAGIHGGADAFISWLVELKRRLDLPATLVLAGVSPDAALRERLVDAALADSCHLSNPVSCSREDFQLIFRRGFGEV